MFQRTFRPAVEVLCVLAFSLTAGSVVAFTAVYLLIKVIALAFNLVFWSLPLIIATSLLTAIFAVPLTVMFLVLLTLATQVVAEGRVL